MNEPTTSAFSEDDEPVEEIVAAFKASEKGLTALSVDALLLEFWHIANEQGEHGEDITFDFFSDQWWGLSVICKHGRYTATSDGACTLVGGVRRLLDKYRTAHEGDPVTPGQGYGRAALAPQCDSMKPGTYGAVPIPRCKLFAGHKVPHRASVTVEWPLIDKTTISFGEARNAT